MSMKRMIFILTLANFLSNFNGHSSNDFSVFHVFSFALQTRGDVESREMHYSYLSEAI